LDDEIKEFACRLYFTYYKNLVGLNQEDRSFLKFKSNTLSFCIEVFIHFAMYSQIEAEKKVIQEAIVEYITRMDSEISVQMQVLPDVQVATANAVEDPRSHYDTLEEEELTLVTKIDETIVAENVVEDDVAEGMPGVSIEEVFPLPVKPVTGSLLSRSTILYNNLRVTKLLSCVKLFGNAKGKTRSETRALQSAAVERYEPSQVGGGSSRSQSKGKQENMFLKSQGKQENMFLKSQPKGKQENMFFQDIHGFHPLLPLFLISGSFYQQIIQTHALDSWDHALFIQFYLFLEFCFTVLRESYLEKGKQTEAFEIGYALRDLLFTSNQYEERIALCQTLLNLDTQTTRMFLSLTGILSNDICGMIQQTPEDIAEGTKGMHKKAFLEFIKQIPMKEIFSQNVEGIMKESAFYNKSKELYLHIGQRIVYDKSQPYVTSGKNKKASLKTGSKQNTASLKTGSKQNTASLKTGSKTGSKQNTASYKKSSKLFKDVGKVISVKTGGKTYRKNLPKKKANKTKKIVYSNDIFA
jgi:hypothetical protein